MAREVTILGAGLVGSLLGIMLRKRGYEVTLYDKRPDMRGIPFTGGRSINMTISARGWKAVELAGLKDEIDSIAIPMYGRCLHQHKRGSAFQPYSMNNEAIYSVSRGALNKKLMDMAEKCGVKINFEYRCTNVDVATNTVHFELPDGTEQVVKADLLFGADGAFSALRGSYTQLEGVESGQKHLDYGYKELSIPAGRSGEWLMEKNALHIWPRNNHMLIAMPNTNGTFTCTLFMPFRGDVSFARLNTEKEVTDFFDKNFPGVKLFMPGLLKDFFANPTSSLITTHISKWHFEDKSALIGDAAHTIVPFYGQGMNCGFEDCTVLTGLMDKLGGDWGAILSEYESLRKPNGDAVAKLAMLNFSEIRDKVADPAFLNRKKIEKEISSRYPTKFVPVYEMVSFSHTPYNMAMQCIHEQNKLMQKVTDAGDFFVNIKEKVFSSFLEKWVTEYHRTVQQISF